MACAVSAITGMCAVADLRLERARGFPAVDNRQTHVHQNQIGPLLGRRLDAARAIEGENNLVAFAQQAARQHIAIHLVIFDQQN